MKDDIAVFDLLDRKNPDEAAYSIFAGLEDIINYIYSNPKKYMDIKNYCIYNSCVFVETTSFIDFIINLGDE